MQQVENARIAVLGLGYVGLPVAVEFGKTLPTIAFDIDQGRIAELLKGSDRTKEVTSEELNSAGQLTLSCDPASLANANVFIVAVPTPIDSFKRPDFSALLSACALVGPHLRQDSLVIFESTVYPGATEEICAPALEQSSGLVFNQDFFCGYSPERANPGDPHHRLTNIVKITAGSTPAAAAFVDALYRTIITAGTHPVGSIRVAEAAKVIENTQRDVNIALVNEFAMIFNRMGIDTREILQAAGTKWNFLPFTPGLVGGHCIGVDPYYLTHKARQIGHHPDVILAGRRINDSMGEYVAGQILRLLTGKGINPVGAKILILGLAFKENCADLRNSRVVDIVTHLKHYSADISIYDPWIDPQAALEEYGLSLISEPKAKGYDAVILAVAHKDFIDAGPAFVRKLAKANAVIYDVKSVLPREVVDGRL